MTELVETEKLYVEDLGLVVEVTHTCIQSHAQKSLVILFFNSHFLPFSRVIWLQWKVLECLSIWKERIK